MLKKLLIILFLLFLYACSSTVDNTFNKNKAIEVQIQYEDSDTTETEVFDSLEDFTRFLNSQTNLRNFVFYFDDEYKVVFEESMITTNAFNLYAKSIVNLIYYNNSNTNLELVEEQLDAFMNEYPYIKVAVTSRYSGSYSSSDVFVNDDITESIRYALDITSYFNNDTESREVLKHIGDAGIFYDNRRLFLPRPLELKGIMINLDIFKERSLVTNSLFRMDQNGYPMKNWTIEEFIEVAKAVKDFNLEADDYYDKDYILGLDTWYGLPDFQYIMPSMDNNNVGYHTWDGTKFNFKSASWKTAMQLSLNLNALKDGTTTKFDDEIYEKNPELTVYHIQNGTVAMDIERSSQFWVLNDAAEKGINLGFWPYPQGSSGFFPPTIVDYIAVSKSTEHIEESYLLAKWMSYGKGGYEALLDYFDTRNVLPVYFPVTTNKDLWLKLNSIFKDIEGINYIFDNINNAKPDLSNMIPGYKEFISWLNDRNNPYSLEELYTSQFPNLDIWGQEWEKKSSEIIRKYINYYR